jgi:hypothetical protein
VPISRVFVICGAMIASFTINVHEKQVDRDYQTASMTEGTGNQIEFLRKQHATLAHTWGKQLLR